MKLKVVIIEKARETGKFVSINKAGVFHFSKDFIQENGFKENDLIDFLQDEERPKDWYITKSATGQSRLRASGKLGGLMVNCSFMAKKIKTSIDFDVDKTLNVPIGSKDQVDAMDIYPIITAKFNK